MIIQYCKTKDPESWRDRGIQKKKEGGGGQRQLNYLLIALRGLSTLRTLRILRNPMPEPPKMEIRDTDTTTISKQLNGDL